MRYEFKPAAEAAWAVGIAVLTVLATSLTFEGTAPGDWQTWAVGVGVGVARAVVGALLDVLRRWQAAHTA